MESNENPTNMNAIDNAAIARPGGKNHHQTKLWMEEVNADWAFESIVPHEILVGSPNPRNVKAASVRIAVGTVRAVLA